MKAISVQQPYADWIVDGKKAVENRTWPCDYRGLLLIHASKTKRMAYEIGDGNVKRRVYGAIVGWVTLFDCLHIDLLRQELTAGSQLLNRWITRLNEHHIEGPFCWCMSEPRRFLKPIPYRGRLGLFDVPDELLTPDVVNSDLPLFGGGKA
jgi:hypothetical protein